VSILGIGLGILGVGGIGAAIAFIPGAAAVAGKAASGALSFLSKLPPWVFAVAAAVLFGLWCLHGKQAAEAKIPALRQAAANSHQAFLLEKRAFATEKASLDRANGLIDASNKRIDAAHIELERERVNAAADEARNAKLARSTDQQIAALTRAAGQHQKPCTLSSEAKMELNP
jgi:hypothetical protein